MKISFKAETPRDVVLHLLIMLSLGLVLILAFFYLYLPAITHHGEMVSVPDFQGLTVTEAIDQAEKNGLEIMIDDSTFKVGAKANTIYYQYPESNNQVKVGRQVFVHIYTATPPMATVPNFVGRTLFYAQAEIEGLGFQLGTLTYIPDITAQNTVLRQLVNGKEIKENTQLPKGTKIDFEVSDGEGTKEFILDNLIGMPVDEAKYLLNSNRLQIGTIIYQDKPDTTQNIIFRQKPSSGTKVREGQEVDLWIYGKDPDKPASAGGQ